MEEAKFKVGDLVRRITSKENKPLKVISASYIYYCGGQSWRYVLEDGFEAWEYSLVAYVNNRSKKRGHYKKHKHAEEENAE